MANSVDPDQTSPSGAIWSRSALFAFTKMFQYLIFSQYLLFDLWVLTESEERRQKHPCSFVPPLTDICCIPAWWPGTHRLGSSCWWPSQLGSWETTQFFLEQISSEYMATAPEKDNIWHLFWDNYCINSFDSKFIQKHSYKRLIYFTRKLHIGIFYHVGLTVILSFIEFIVDNGIKRVNVNFFRFSNNHIHVFLDPSYMTHLNFREC